MCVRATALLASGGLWGIHEIMNLCFMNCEEQNIIVRKYDYEGDDQGCYERGARGCQAIKYSIKPRDQIKEK